VEVEGVESAGGKGVTEDGKEQSEGEEGDRFYWGLKGHSRESMCSIRDGGGGETQGGAGDWSMCSD
jgi:hypothetical protein